MALVFWLKIEIHMDDQLLRWEAALLLLQISPSVRFCIGARTPYTSFPLRVQKNDPKTCFRADAKRSANN